MIVIKLSVRTISLLKATVLTQVDGNAFSDKTIITVEAEDGTTKTYTFTFKQGIVIKSSDATLKSASFEGGTFNKTFSPDIYDYEVTFHYK